MDRSLPDTLDRTRESLHGRTALVTGASRGIGLAVAQRLVSAGANVVLTARTAEAAQEAASGLGERAAGFGAHVADEEAANACASFALERYGSLDILVNNAGTNPSTGLIVDADRPRFAKTVDVNLWGPVLWSGVAWRAWMRDHGGAIVNVASIGGLETGPDLGIYRTTKAALIHLTRQLAFELAPRVRVNVVAPGLVRTRLASALWEEREALLNQKIPLGRIGEPEEVAAAIEFLASDAASFMTGSTLVIDGGQLLADDPVAFANAGGPSFADAGSAPAAHA